MSEPFKDELDEEIALREKLSDILTRTANALHGGPHPNGFWSWHDLPELAAAKQWQPFATAPKDGTCIWVLMGTGMCIAYWGGESWYNGDKVLLDYGTPTHWMPLPMPQGGMRDRTSTGTWAFSFPSSTCRETAMHFHLTSNIIVILYNPFRRCRNPNLTPIFPGIAILNCRW